MMCTMQVFQKGSQDSNSSQHSENGKVALALENLNNGRNSQNPTMDRNGQNGSDQNGRRDSDQNGRNGRESDAMSGRGRGGNKVSKLFSKSDIWNPYQSVRSADFHAQKTFVLMLYADADGFAGQGGGKTDQVKRRHLSSGDLEGTSTVDFCPQVNIMMVKTILIKIIKIMFSDLAPTSIIIKIIKITKIIDNKIQISHQPRRLSGKLSPCPEMQAFPGAISTLSRCSFQSFQMQPILPKYYQGPLTPVQIVHV